MELLLDAVGAAALPIGGFFCLQHALTLRHQPNTTLSGWNTVALGHGTGAAACLYFASPLLRLVLGDLGWLPAAVVAALTLLIFVLQAARHAALNGCCAGPDAWPQTATLDGEDYQLLRQFVARQCDTLAPKYSFGMSLAKAWRLHNPAAEASWQDMQATREQAGKESAVTHLFHGTSEESARAIVADGFRLPSSAGMFGKGLYFADCPLKSLQYASLPCWLGGGCGCAQRYMLVCAVELGRTKVKTNAKNLDPDLDLQPSLLRRTLGGQPDNFDSVSARPKRLFGLGLRAPEYVVYRATQALPLFLLQVEQVDKGVEGALTADGVSGRSELQRKEQALAQLLAAAATMRARKEQTGEQQSSPGGSAQAHDKKSKRWRLFGRARSRSEEDRTALV